MNISVPYQWLKEYLKTSVNVQELARRLTDCGNSVERFTDIGATYEKMIVGKIKQIRPHPTADRLRLVTVDVGRAVKGSKTIEVVCGGTNLTTGQLVVVALPGAKVRWHGEEGELVELIETEIRGVKSQGMICAPEEIGFEKLALGERKIWDLTLFVTSAPGSPLAKALGIEDTLLDIEVTTNRPDAMSIVGLAREAAAAGLGNFQEPKRLNDQKIFNVRRPVKLSITVQDKRLCPRYQAVVIDGVTVGPSPWWLQKRLLLSGHRPINNVVDVTNYVLHEFGQPLHAFDAENISGGRLHVRPAEKNEKILALDGRTYDLDQTMLVIADERRPIAIAGVMGGQETGAVETTNRILLEAANFEPVSIRRTARSLNLFSDSSSQFEKGLSPEATEPALRRAVELICELTGGHVASSIVDVRVKPYKPVTVLFDGQAVRERIGLPISDGAQRKILRELGFDFQRGGQRVVVPFWRDRDIEDAVDLSEEVARMIGYVNIPSILPNLTTPPAQPENRIKAERAVKRALCGAGCTEISSYAFTSLSTLQKYGMAEKEAVKIENPLSDAWTHLRPSLIPTMLEVIEMNQHNRASAEIFEVADVHFPRRGDIPRTDLRLLIAVYHHDGFMAFRRAKGLLERLCRETSWPFPSLKRADLGDRWHSGRGAAMILSDKKIGTIGEIHPSLAAVFGIDRRVVLVDFSLDLVLPYLFGPKRAESLPTFPGLWRDLSFFVDERAEHEKIVQVLRRADLLILDVEFVDLFFSEEIEKGKKAMTYRLELRAPDRTLSSDEAAEVIQKAVRLLQEEFKVEIR